MVAINDELGFLNLQRGGECISASEGLMPLIILTGRVLTADFGLFSIYDQ